MGIQAFTGGGRRRAWLTLVFASTLVIAPALASGASARMVTKRDNTPVRTQRLSPAERRAITINSISAVADPSLGLIVTATFDGNIERYLGQGDLKTGLVALELVPRSSRTRPGGLADEGGGFAVTRIPVIRGAGKATAVVARTVGMFSPEAVLHVRTPPEAGVVRTGNQIVFYLGRAGLSRIGRIKLKVFARAPVTSGRSTAAVWQAILKSPAAEAASVPVDPTRMTYYGLASPRDALAALLTAGVQPELLRQEQTATALNASIHRYPTVAGAIAKQPTLPKESQSELVAYRGTTASRVGRLRGEDRVILSVIGQFDALIRARTPPPVQVVQTDAGFSQDMAAQPQVPFSAPPPPGTPLIDVNDQVRYQTFRGLGAAMTDSSAWLIHDRLSSPNQAALMQDLFGSAAANALGAPAIHLNFLRVGIAATGAMTCWSQSGTPGCSDAAAAYSYDDMPAGQTDPGLSNFSIAHDTAYIIPTLQQALQINPGLEVEANPWSSPGWMKSNDALDNTNNDGSLLLQYYQTYAEYIVKFVQAYQAQGIPISAVAPANEPTTPTQYPGLNLPEPAEAQFIANDLKPLFAANGLNTKIYGNDLSWDQYATYANPLASDPSAGPDLAGMFWHCYFGSPTVMSQLQQAHPNLDQIVNECSPEIRGFGTPEFLISTLRNWASVDAIWSVALDPNGQPIQTPNSCGGCRGIVSIDQNTGAVSFRTEYYQLGQISAFVQPGAVRIDSPNFVTYSTNSSNIETVSSGLDDVAFLNPNGSKVLIAYNTSSGPITFAVQSDGGYYTYTIPSQAMTTFVWR